MEAETLDIENRDELQRYLSANFAPAEEFAIREFRVLAGGVSSRTVLVELAGGQRWVLKQALAKLRVQADWFSDPARVHREALGMRVLGELVPGRVPKLIFDDERHHVLGMEAVPEPHDNWKAMLLAGDIDGKIAGRFGELLGTIHRESWRRREELAPLFDDRSFFESLRIEPYYQYSAAQEPRAAAFLEELIAETRATRLALVHGDFSPKNVLVRDRQVTLLDHEVIHWGDPAFDVGFAVSHFIGKGFAGKAASDFDAGSVSRDYSFRVGIPPSTASHMYPFWQQYRHAVSGVEWPEGFERRCARHSLACVLARCVGRSPLEYLSPDVRRLLSVAVLDVINHSPFPDDIHAVATRISCALYGFYQDD